MNPKSPAFTLKSADETFLQRQKNVFDQLSKLEKPQTTSTEVDPDKYRYKTARQVQKTTLSNTYKGKESIFKRPQEPLNRRNMQRIPDFKKNPHKWTKYTLDDVKDEDMSDKSNTKAALSFLNELRQRREESIDEINMETGEEAEKRIVFKKTVKYNKTKECSSSDKNEEESPSFSSSKLIMPEYVVGGKTSKTKKTVHHKSEKKSKGAEMKLDHLFEGEDD